MRYLKKSTVVKVSVGPFLDKNDAVTPEAGITLSGADSAELMKHDGGSTVDISGRTWVHIDGGYYNLSLAVSDTDTVGMVRIWIRDDDVCLPVWEDFMVLPGAIYDALVAGTGNLQVKLTSDALDSVSVVSPSGVASNFREMLVQVWRRFFKKATMTSSQLKTYADNGTDVLTTQTLSDDGTTQTQGTAS
jgi:hypothetical protein